MKEQSVTFRHFRFVGDRLVPYSRKRKHARRGRPNGKGGMTICAVLYPDGTHVIGTATCSCNDAFDYQVGRLLARTDADEQYIAMLLKRQEAKNEGTNV